MIYTIIVNTSAEHDDDVLDAAISLAETVDYEGEPWSLTVHKEGVGPILDMSQGDDD